MNFKKILKPFSQNYTAHSVSKESNKMIQTNINQKGAASKGLLIMCLIVLIGFGTIWYFMYTYTNKLPTVASNEVKQLLIKEKCKMVGYVSRDSLTSKDRYRYECNSGMIYETALKFPDNDKALTGEQLKNEDCKVAETIISDNFLSKRYVYKCESGLSFTVFADDKS